MIYNIQTTSAVAVGPLVSLNPHYPFSVQVTVTAASGAVSGSVTIECSNDSVHWVAVGTAIAPSGTTTATAGQVFTAPYAYIRANTTAISAASSITVLLNK